MAATIPFQIGHAAQHQSLKIGVRQDVKIQDRE
jgi:hypothetical protein